MKILFEFPKEILIETLKTKIICGIRAEKKTDSYFYTILSRLKKRGFITSRLSKNIPPKATIGLTPKGRAYIFSIIDLFQQPSEKKPLIDLLKKEKITPTVDSEMVDSLNPKVYILVEEMLHENIEDVSEDEKAKLYTIAEKVLESI
jgi:DNA-binding PadR family transcriptional regulator